jgi:tRNA U34 5-methylaminomethyl-2-thiouridine-forming methyltransferase MnmC
MKREVKSTHDGSKTLYVPELDEHYHSIHGARQESEHVFIQWGLKQASAVSSLSILEVGFGTGLNALLTVFSKPNDQYIQYVGIEPFPVDEDLLAEYSVMFSSEEQVLFNQLHQAEWNKSVSIKPQFQLEKVNLKLEDYSLMRQFDLIYFDAFGPRAQAELWVLPVFEKMYRLTRNGGRLVTYCAKGQVKRDLKAAGFIVNSVPGPPGKREMTIATKI